MISAVAETSRAIIDEVINCFINFLKLQNSQKNWRFGQKRIF